MSDVDDSAIFHPRMSYAHCESIVYMAKEMDVETAPTPFVFWAQ